MAEKISVLQDWVQELPLMQQTVLLTAIRGPDGIPKYHTVKFLLRWLRRCVLLSAMDRKVLATPYEPGGGSFTGPSFDAEKQKYSAAVGLRWQDSMDGLVSDYLRALDELPHHFQMHFMHAAEIIGYQHADDEIRQWWKETYYRLVNDLHLNPETREQLEYRLADNREQWLARNDSATVE